MNLSWSDVDFALLRDGIILDVHKFIRDRKIGIKLRAEVSVGAAWKDVYLILIEFNNNVKKTPFNVA